MDFHLVSGTVWLLCGLTITYLAYLIAIQGRVDLHQHYDESVDPQFAARWAGGSALFMGLFTIGYGLREIRYGFDPLALGVLITVLVVCSYLSGLFARGVGSRT